MKFNFRPDAEIEFVEAVAYYEDCEKGLGIDFSVEIFATIERIVELPKAWSILDSDIRRCLTSRFPYGVIYSIEPNNNFYTCCNFIKK